jgi:hypothetical protein
VLCTGSSIRFDEQRGAEEPRGEELSDHEVEVTAEDARRLTRMDRAVRLAEVVLRRHPGLTLEDAAALLAEASDAAQRLTDDARRTEQYVDLQARWKSAEQARKAWAASLLPRNVITVDFIGKKRVRTK